MIKNNYALKIIELGVKYGKNKKSNTSNTINRIRNKIYNHLSIKDVPRIFCYENNNKPKENYYRLNLPREIINNEILILESIKEYRKAENFFNKYIFKPVLYLTSSFVIFSVYNVNSFFILTSFFMGVYALLKTTKLVGYNNIIVDSIYLKSCGRKIIINTLTNKLEVDIFRVRKMRITEIYFFKTFLDHLEEEFIPIVADYEVFLIPKSLEYVDKEILFAITHSCYIENK